MRVSKRRGRSCLGFSTVDPARHFHSELTDSAHFDEKRPSVMPQEQKRHIPKSRVDCTFLQIVVQSPIFNCKSESRYRAICRPKTVFISRALSPTLEEVDWSSVAEQGLEVSSK